MSKVIVVGVDASGTARKAAEAARDLAAALGASLHVVSAYDSDRSEVFGSGSDQLVVTEVGTAGHVAQTVAESLKGPGVDVTFSAVRGRPADALIREAQQVNASIIVVGNRRMKGIGRVLGSVANSVAHNSPCDVYIANTYEAD
jgi:nucleotide-binding universal stress UspA family protein